MERHLSTGVATIVALMTAHRLAAEEDHSASFSETIAHIKACLTTQPDRSGHRPRIRRLHEAE